jgi:hypothetical protein
MPTQLYETTIYDREGHAFSYVTVPARSIVFPAVPDVQAISAELELRPLDPARAPATLLEPVEPWSIPFLIDGLMGRWDGPGFPYEWRLYFDPLNRRGPSEFAQHLTFAKVVPVESSPLAGVSLADIISTHEVSATLGYLGSHPVLLLKTSGVVIVGYAVRGIGQAIQIKLRIGLLRIMGVGGDQAKVLPDEAVDEAPEDDD